MASTIDQQFIEYIVKSLVGHPDDVKVDRRIDEKGVLLELSVNPEDLGRVIGKRGSTAQSIRTLLRALGTKNDARYNLKIVDTGPAPSRAPRTDDNSQTTNAQADDQIDETDSTAAQDQTVTDEIEEQREDERTASENADAEERMPEEPGKESHDDVISRTRKELEDLDDLDV